MKPGIYPDLTNEEYHAAPGHSKTGVQILADKEISHYLHYLEHGTKDTTAKSLGDAIHVAVLEPELFQHAFIDSKPPAELGNWRHDRVAVAVSEGMSIEAAAKTAKVSTSKAEEYLARDDVQQMLEHYKVYPPGSTPSISADDLETAQRCRDAVLAHDEAREYIEGAVTEQSAFWIDEETGLLCKCRPDISKGSILADLKSTRDASPRGFARECGKYGYHLQDAMYSEGWGIATGQQVEAFVFIAVETGEVLRGGKVTHEVAVYQLGTESHQRGIEAMRFGLEKYASWEASKSLGSEIWTGYPKEITEIDVPAWA